MRPATEIISSCLAFHGVTARELLDSPQLRKCVDAQKQIAWMMHEAGYSKKHIARAIAVEKETVASYLREVR